MKLLFLAPAALLILASHALAQNINIDFGTVGTAPASTFGGAAAQPGVWNTVGNDPPGLITPLVDTNGGFTGASILSIFGTGNGPVTVDDPSTFGDDAALLDDYVSVSAATGERYMISNLPLSSTYHVYVYSWSPNLSAALTNVLIYTGGPSTSVGGAWTGAYGLGVTHAAQSAVGSSGGSTTIFIDVTPPPGGVAVINGIQLVRMPTESWPFCVGLTSPVLNCPNCGISVFGTGGGCPNSISPLGAGLSWSGNPGASPATDSLRFIAQGVTGPCLFLQSDSLGAQSVFGDGLLCASIGLRRLEIVMPVGNNAVLPAGAGSPPIHQQGQVSPGDTKYYQCWYRDSAAFCTSATFNTTSGWSLTWLP